MHTQAGMHGHLEVVNEFAGALSEGAMVGDHTAALQQQQIIKRLWHTLPLQHCTSTYHQAGRCSDHPC